MNDEFQGVPRQDPQPDATASERLTAAEEKRLLERERTKHERDQRQLFVIGWSGTILIVLIVGILFCASFTLAWHMLTPKNMPECGLDNAIQRCWQWLKDDQLTVVKNFMLSGALVGLGTTYMRRFVDN